MPINPIHNNINLKVFRVYILQAYVKSYRHRCKFKSPKHTSSCCQAKAMERNETEKIVIIYKNRRVLFHFRNIVNGKLLWQIPLMELLWQIPLMDFCQKMGTLSSYGWQIKVRFQFKL